jgi:hypothetical protein
VTEISSNVRLTKFANLILAIIFVRIVWSEVDVMITIFGNFYKFSAKKLVFFFKNQFYYTLLAECWSVLSQKRQFFHRFLGEKIYFFNHNIGPWR